MRKAPRRAPVSPRPGPAALAPRAAPSRTTLAALVALIATYAVVYGVVAVVKYRYYLFIDIDLPIFVQATDQALRGSLFSSIRGMVWLGDHVSLVLFVLAPLYALFRHPLTLLLIQCVTLALGAWPVFALARRELQHDGLSLVCAALYLLYPALGYCNLFEFHPEALATTTLLATIGALAASRFVPMVVFAILSLACKEDVALPVGILGLMALLTGRSRRPGLTLIGLALGSLVLSFGVVRPALSSAAAEYGRMYGRWGAGPAQIAGHLLAHPFEAVRAFFDTPGDPGDAALKRAYWPQMLGPFLFLPLLSPGTLVVALPVLAEHFLSYRNEQHWMLFQYTALVTPVMAAAAVRGYATLVRRISGAPITAAVMARPGRARSAAFAIAGAALAASLLCNLLYGPLLRRGWLAVPQSSETRWPNAFDRTLRPYRDRMVARVPKTGGVVAAFEFLARLASRPETHSIHHIYTGYYTFSRQPYPVPTGVVAMLADIGDQRLADYVGPNTAVRLRQLMDQNRLRPADAAGDLLLLTREPADTVELVRVGAPPAAVPRRVVFDGQLAFTGSTMLDSATTAGGLLPIQTTWRRIARPDRYFVVQFVVRDAVGEPRFSLLRHLGYLLYPEAIWPADTTVRETYRMIVPNHLPPGAYSLGLRVLWWRTSDDYTVSKSDDPRLAQTKELADLGRFTVTEPPHR